MMNQLARYLPVLGTLERAAGPVLEIGSGSAGVGRWTRRPFVGCDRSFRDYADAEVERDGPMRPVRGDAIRLPFRDRSFGAVLCLDMIEHVPAPDRRAVIREICRVARGPVILAFPWGAGVSVWDRRLERHLRRRARPIPAWLSEHLAVEPPDPDRVAEDLRACGFRVARRGAAPALTHYLLMCAEARPRLGHRLTKLSRRVSLALTGRARGRLDLLLVRLALRLYPACARLTASSRGYRAYLFAHPARSSEAGAPV